MSKLFIYGKHLVYLEAWSNQAFFMFLVFKHTYRIFMYRQILKQLGF